MKATACMCQLCSYGFSFNLNFDYAPWTRARATVQNTVLQNTVQQNTTARHLVPRRAEDTQCNIIAEHVHIFWLPCAFRSRTRGVPPPRGCQRIGIYDIED